MICDEMTGSRACSLLVAIGVLACLRNVHRSRRGEGGGSSLGLSFWL